MVDIDEVIQRDPPTRRREAAKSRPDGRVRPDEVQAQYILICGCVARPG
ncbi:MAG: hypothetical protein ACLUUF_00360 [Bifidobacterium pullorum]